MPLNPDSDTDLLNDYLEITIGTDPLNNDTDGDLLSDYDEYRVYGSDPLLSDTDGDGWTDYEEVMLYGSDPLLADTDGDGIIDPLDILGVTVHWVFPLGGLLIMLFIAAVVVKRFKEKRAAEEYLTTAEPASEGLEPGMDVVVEYKIRGGKVIFGVVVRNDSPNIMSNVMVILGIPDLTDAIKSQNVGNIEPSNNAVLQIEFELQPGAEGELVGMIEYDSAEGEHRVVNLRPVRIVA